MKRDGSISNFGYNKNEQLLFNEEFVEMAI
jgi:hypothetical protein